MNPTNKHPNSLIAYCIEQVIGYNRTAAAVARETKVAAKTIGDWLTKHWFGSRQYDSLIFRGSKINTDNE